jgi:hypothetical protein
VAYTPDWEPLADALKRVMTTGVAENEAKTDLCRAVADRKINVRVRIAASDSMGGQFFSDGNVGVPRHLNPDDFDWTRSRPLRPWSIGPMLGQHYSWDWEDRPIDLIELLTSDVKKVLHGASARAGVDILPPTVGRVSSGAASVPYKPAAPKSKPGPGAKKQGITDAINQLWPHGIPRGLSAKDRNRQIIDWLTRNQYSVPGNPERAIQRVLKAQSK